MNEKCSCQTYQGVHSGLRSRRIIRLGSYFRKSDSKRVPRFFCHSCSRRFSFATLAPTYRQKRRLLNFKIYELHGMGVAQREIARVLRCNPKTVARKLVFMAAQKRKANSKLVSSWCDSRQVERVYFDEMETSHHTKLKPLSIPLAVTKERVILGFKVAIMPAKGHLAAISRRKYGPRPDHRPRALNELLSALKANVNPRAEFHSDECPRYPVALRKHFPECKQIKSKSRRARVAGQGEMKEGGFDPLFPLNHTAAMLRAHINRLFRRTWCTTKRIDRLGDHIDLYVHRHNSRRLRSLRGSDRRLVRSTSTG